MNDRPHPARPVEEPFPVLPDFLGTPAAAGAFVRGPQLALFDRLHAHIHRLKKQAFWHAVQRVLDETDCRTLRVRVGSVIDGRYTLDAFTGGEPHGAAVDPVCATRDPSGCVEGPFATLKVALDALHDREMYEFFASLRSFRFERENRAEMAHRLFDEAFLVRCAAASLDTACPADAATPSLVRPRL